MKINRDIPKLTPGMKVQVQPIRINGETKLEIERRFLVKYLPKNLDEYVHEYIVQGYLATKEGTSIRLRMKGDKFYQTIKKGTGKIREETEVEISKSLYYLLWDETKGRRLKKTRYDIPHEDKIFELDIYHGKLEGFETVEVEFNSEKECDNFIPLGWFGAEVTGIKEFTNKNLATYGIPKKLLRKLTKRG